MPDTFSEFLRTIYREEVMRCGLTVEEYEYAVRWIVYQSEKKEN
jgi:Cu2+-containing amine oxidase